MTKAAKPFASPTLPLLALVPRTMLGLYPVSFVMKLPPRCLPALNLLLGFTGLLSFGHRRVFARLPTSPAGSSR
jgi:ABC-type branched-subunit amino acid transport system permease subunit